MHTKRPQPYVVHYSALHMPYTHCSCDNIREPSLFIQRLALTCKVLTGLGNFAVFPTAFFPTAFYPFAFFHLSFNLLPFLPLALFLVAFFHCHCLSQRAKRFIAPGKNREV